MSPLRPRTKTTPPSSAVNEASGVIRLPLVIPVRGILMARHVSFSAIEFRGCGNEVVATVACGSSAAAAAGGAA